uniref:arylacetamide deacetylase-like 4 n=1 Tax=Euleptes europaea TaxID=460621 RepID=UPI00254012D0|nr:arylacetamide deacetylase-like 4 [Euleptes europaea]
MVLIWNVLAQVAYAVLAAVFLWLGWALHYHFSTTKVPCGVCQPLKLRILHVIGVLVFSLDHICWKMGFCHRFTMVRFLIDGIPPSDDPMLSIKDYTFEGVPVRSYQPKRPQAGLQRGILFFHGGCGIFGSIDAYERWSRYVTKESDSVLISVGYRLAPESPYPSQFNDCLDATVHFMKSSENYGVDPARIILCGDSFGGMLTAYLCQELKSRTDLPKVRAQVLICPVLQSLDCRLPSYQQNCFFPILTRVHIAKIAAVYLDKPTSLVDMALAGNLIPESFQMKYKKWVNSDNIPQEIRIRNHNPALPPAPEDNLFNVISKLLSRRLCPLLAEDSFVKGLPETYIQTCEYDVLRDDGLLYKKRLEDNGVSVSWYHLEDGFHDCQALINHWFITFSNCKRGVSSVIDYVKGL